MKILFLLMVLATPAFAECPLTLADAPRVAKIRLGSTVEEAKVDIDSVFLRPFPAKSETGLFYPLKPGQAQPLPRRYDVGVEEWTARTGVLIPKSLSNVSALVVQFYEGKIFKVMAYYSNLDFEWNGLRDATASLGDSWGIRYPWKFERDIGRLTCAGFEVVTSVPNQRGSLMVGIADSAVDKTVRDKITQAMLAEDLVINRSPEEKKKAFKP